MEFKVLKIKIFAIGLMLLSLQIYGSAKLRLNNAKKEKEIRFGPGTAAAAPAFQNFLRKAKKVQGPRKPNTANSSVQIKAVASAALSKSKQKVSPLSSLFKKRYPAGIDQQLWQEIVTKLNIQISSIEGRILKIPGIVNDNSYMHSLAWNPNGTQIATCSVYHETIHIWDVDTVNISQQLKDPNKLNTVAWSPNGRQIASASDDKIGRIWDIATGKIVFELKGHEKWVKSIAWNSTGTLIATASPDKTARIWDAHTGKIVHILQGHDDSIWSIAWNPAGTLLATASEDKTVRIWDISSGNQIQLLKGHTKGIHAIAWNPNGLLLATSSNDGTIRIWNTSIGKTELELPGAYHAEIAWNPAGTRITISAHDGLSIWDIASKTKVYRFENLISSHFNGNYIQSISYNPAGTHLAISSYDSIAHIWDLSPLIQYEQLIKGSLLKKQLMFILLCEEYKKRFPNKSEVKLQDIAQHILTKRITIAELTRVLLSFHPLIRNPIITTYNLVDAQEKIKIFIDAEEKIKRQNEFLAVKEAIFPPLAGDPIKNTLEEYFIGPRPIIAKPKDTSAQQMQNQIEKGQKQEIEKGDISTVLFAMIEQGEVDQVKACTNPITILSRSTDLNRTPLMHAITNRTDKVEQRNAIFTFLLNYQGTLVRTQYQSDLRKSELHVTDYHGNTPLMLAIIKDRFDFALAIAKKMTLRGLNKTFSIIRKNNNKNETAYDLALKVNETYKKDKNYQELMKILKKYPKK